MEDILAKGHRSVVYLIEFNGKKAVKKVEKINICAINRIQNEIFWLNKLNKYKIGPRLYSSGQNYFICGYIDGKRIIDYFKESENPKKIILDVLKQCRTMDKLKIDKKEMSNPYKHIIINKNKAIMIDFERAKFSLKPSNVTAFFQFLTSKKVYSILEKKGIFINKDKVIDLLRNYKTNYSEKDFNNLIKKIKIH